MDEETPKVVAVADEIYENLRALAHLTANVNPAPVVYSVLGNIKAIGHMLPQSLAQMSAGLGRSLNDFDVYEDDGSDPVASVAEAVDHLTRAAALAAELGAELSKAQTAINKQGYRETPAVGRDQAPHQG